MYCSMTGFLEACNLSSRKGQRLSSAPSMSLRGGADYLPLVGGRGELSKGRSEESES